MTEAHPLSWPAGWPRTPLHRRQDSKYRFARGAGWRDGGRQFWTFAAARDELLAELHRLGGKSAVLSTNFPTDRLGMATEKGRRPEDQGVALYFTLKGKPMVMACDMHMRAEENMRSLTLAIDAMRALERHGGGVMMERAFDGFKALPAPGTALWYEVLQVPPTATVEEIKVAFRTLAMDRHPDHGGSDAAMADLVRARDFGLKLRGAA